MPRTVALLSAVLVARWQPVGDIVLPYRYNAQGKPGQLGVRVTAMSGGSGRLAFVRRCAGLIASRAEKSATNCHWRPSTATRPALYAGLVARAPRGGAVSAGGAAGSFAAPIQNRGHVPI